jgi:hypothetical protein
MLKNFFTLIFFWSERFYDPLGALLQLCTQEAQHQDVQWSNNILFIPFYGVWIYIFVATSWIFHTFIFLKSPRGCHKLRSMEANKLDDVQPRSALHRLDSLNPCIATRFNPLRYQPSSHANYILWCSETFNTIVSTSPLGLIFFVQKARKPALTRPFL